MYAVVELAAALFTGIPGRLLTLFGHLVLVCEEWMGGGFNVRDGSYAAYDRPEKNAQNGFCRCGSDVSDGSQSQAVQVRLRLLPHPGRHFNTPIPRHN